MTLTADIGGNLNRVRDRIAAAADRNGRKSHSVTLVAVTKTVSADVVLAAVRAGAADLGENYVQEAREKIPEVHSASLSEEASGNGIKPPFWHLIGRLQSNKAKYAVGLFDLIQSVDSLSQAREIGRQAAKTGKRQAILIEVNLDRNAAERAGVDPGSLDDLVGGVLNMPGLTLRGLMGIAPREENGNAQDSAGALARPHFRRLRTLWETLPEPNRLILSMGMSADFEEAIEEGATLVRVGTAIFGQRKV